MRTSTCDSSSRNGQDSVCQVADRSGSEHTSGAVSDSQERAHRVCAEYKRSAGRVVSSRGFYFDASPGA